MSRRRDGHRAFGAEALRQCSRLAVSPAEARQFRVLFRHFFFRFLDNELLAARGELRQTMVHVVALLGALGFLISLGMVLRHVFGYGGEFAARRVQTWPDQEILASLTITAAGLMTVFLWDALFPDRRDCLALSSLPVSMRAMFAAKVLSMISALGVVVAAVNAFPGLAIPVLLVPADAGALALARSLAAYWTTMAAAGAFVFLLLLGGQGLLVQCLPHRHFQRISAYAQMAAFFAVLTLFFLTPPLAHPQALAAAKNQALLAWLPSLWFFGLHQWLLGAGEPVFQILAGYSAKGLAAALVIVLATYGLGYARHMRKMVEQPEAAPESARRRFPLLDWLGRLWMRRPLERAMFQFITRTLARSRQHRMLLAIYCGAGLAYAFHALSRFLYGRMEGRWFQPTHELVGVSLDPVFFPLVGLRVAMALPVELKANWIFRLTERADPGEHIAAMRRAMTVLVVGPLVAVSLPVFGLLWGWWAAARHVVFVALVGLILIEALTARFHKIPFACSWLPGKANLKVMFGVYWLLFFFFSELAAEFDLAGLRQPPVFLRIGLLFCAALAILRWRRRTDFRFVFEDEHEPVLTTLNLTGQRLSG